VTNRPFPVDVQTDEVIPQKLRVVKPGYDPIETTIGWEDGKTDYKVDLTAKTKIVRFITDPPGAIVTIDGKALDRDRNGSPSTTLQFPPLNERGELKTYTAVISKKTADSEWEPQKMTVAWDSGRPDYSVALKEILTRPVQMLTAKMQRNDEGWEIVPELSTTIAMKDVTEGPKKEPPQQITKLPRGTQIDTLAVSPDGSRLLFTVLYGNAKSGLRSQMIAIHTDGTAGQDFLNDGKSLEITPSYSPAGDQVVFSSNRAGRRLSVWEMSATGAGGITQLTRGDTNDLWPTIDNDPKQRLFYQANVDTRPDSRLYMTARGSTTLTDLTPMSGAQPRVSPKADFIVFTAVNDKTGKRDIYMMPDRGGVPRNLTNTPDVDEFDPVWNKDGTRLAFVSDAGVDEERRQNLDIWVLDLSHPERPVQITTNGSWDDHPAWDPTGNSIYFRSNRGGEWAIWKVVAR
jgi:TolB protein